MEINVCERIKVKKERKRRERKKGEDGRKKYMYLEVKIGPASTIYIYPTDNLSVGGLQISH